MQGGDANEILYIMWNTITGRRTSVPELWTKSSWSKSETDGWRPAWKMCIRDRIRRIYGYLYRYGCGEKSESDD